MKVSFVKQNQEAISVHVLAAQQTPTVDSLINYIEDYQQRPGQLMIHERGRLQLIATDSIIAVEVHDKTLTITTTSAQHHLRSALSTFMKDIEMPSLILVSQSAAINLAYLVAIQASFSGTMNARLKNSMHIPISRRYTANIRSELMATAIHKEEKR